MKKFLLMLVLAGCSLPLMAAYQYNYKGNRTWLTFDSATTVALDLGRSGKDNDHGNFIVAAKVSPITAGTILKPEKPDRSPMVLRPLSVKMTASDFM